MLSKGRRGGLEETLFAKETLAPKKKIEKNDTFPLMSSAPLEDATVAPSDIAAARAAKKRRKRKARLERERRRLAKMAVGPSASRPPVPVSSSEEEEEQEEGGEGGAAGAGGAPSTPRGRRRRREEKRRLRAEKEKDRRRREEEREVEVRGNPWYDDLYATKLEEMVVGEERKGPAGVVALSSATRVSRALARLKALRIVSLPVVQAAGGAGAAAAGEFVGWVSVLDIASFFVASLPAPRGRAVNADDVAAFVRGGKGRAVGARTLAALLAWVRNDRPRRPRDAVVVLGQRNTHASAATMLFATGVFRALLSDCSAAADDSSDDSGGDGGEAAAAGGLAAAEEEHQPRLTTPLREGMVLSQSDVIRYIARRMSENERMARFGERILVRDLGRAVYPGPDGREQQQQQQQLVTVSRQATVLATLRVLRAREANAAAVTGQSGELLGNFSVSDLRGISSMSFLADNVYDYLATWSPRSLHVAAVREDDTLGRVVRLVAERHLHRLWVVDDRNRPVRMIGLTEIMAVAVRSYPHLAVDYFWPTDTGAAAAAAAASASAAAAAEAPVVASLERAAAAAAAAGK